MPRKITKRETLCSGKFLRFVNKHFEEPVVGTGVWECIERTNTPRIAAAVIVAITKDNELILERNWRFPIEGYVIQLPAGLIDKTGEKPADTARRELLEETGYLAKELIPLIQAPEDPVLTPTIITHFLARGVEYAGGERQDAAEEIEVLKVPLPELAEFLLHLPADTALDLRVTGILWMLEKAGLL